MIVLLVILEALISISIKSLLFDTTNETNVFGVFNDTDIDVSQLSESINNNTEDNIQQNCNNQKEERQIINRSEVETLSILWSSRLRG